MNALGVKSVEIIPFYMWIGILLSIALIKKCKELLLVNSKMIQKRGIN